jgi:hypothetical protein
MVACSVLRQPQANLLHRRRLSLQFSAHRFAAMPFHGPWAGFPFRVLCLLEACMLAGLAFAGAWSRDLLLVAMWGLFYAYLALCRRRQF